MRPIGTAGIDEIVVDGRGSAYANSIEVDFAAGDGLAVIAVIAPDGAGRRPETSSSLTAGDHARQPHVDRRRVVR